MKLVVLGSGGWIPTARRETCCYLVRQGSEVLLLDAGTGLRRLLDRPEATRDVTTINVVLSHFHLDHIVGLSYLPALGLSGSTTIWGPGESLYGASTRTVLARILGPPYFSGGLGSIASDIRELDEGSFEIGGMQLHVRRQSRHSEPTLAFRVGDRLTYCTDTAFDPGNVEFARKSRVLLHEAWHASSETDDAIHSAAGEAARVAGEANVDELVLIHLSPLLESESALEDAARSEFRASRVGCDLESFELG